MEKKKGVSSLDFGKWGRHGLRGLSRGRGERRSGWSFQGWELEILEGEKREPERKQEEKKERKPNLNQKPTSLDQEEGNLAF